MADLSTPEFKHPTFWDRDLCDLEPDEFFRFVERSHETFVKLLQREFPDKFQAGFHDRIVKKMQYIMEFTLANTGLRGHLPCRSEHIEVRRSHIHGTGVFATRDIKKGRLVTIYPAHLICEFASDTSAYSMGTYSDGKCFEYSDDYKYTLTGTLEIIGNPAKTSNKLLVGHMINDSSSIEGVMGNLCGPSDVKRESIAYITRSNNNACCVPNVKSDACTMACVVAMRDIKAGDEVLMSYGPMYWWNKIPGALETFRTLLRTDTTFARTMTVFDISQLPH